jgi:hypothetical protein
VLDKFFPFKASSDMRALKRALAYDQPVGPVVYRQLFQENEDGMHS